jgi:hypothetical protein
VCWLAVLAMSTPAPKITPGTTTPIGDLLHEVHLEFLITVWAAVAGLAQLVGVFRTLWLTTTGRKGQAELVRMAHEAYLRQITILRELGIADPVTGETPASQLPPGGPDGHDDPPVQGDGPRA